MHWFLYDNDLRHEKVKLHFVFFFLPKLDSIIMLKVYSNQELWLP